MAKYFEKNNLIERVDIKAKKGKWEVKLIPTTKSKDYQYLWDNGATKSTVILDEGEHHCIVHKDNKLETVTICLPL